MALLLTGFIQNLIKTGHRLKAIDYIYSFDMVNRFQPVSAILNDFLRITKESAEKSFRDANNESAPQVNSPSFLCSQLLKLKDSSNSKQISQVAAVDKQIKALRAAIRCISCHKLESEFQIGDFKEQVNSLLKLRRDLLDGSGSGSKPNLTIKESQTTKPPNLAEVGSVISNTPLEPEAASSTVSKTSSKKKNKRGQKRVNNQTTVDVASQSSNHSHPGHDSLRQRLIWPVDHYGRSFTGTSSSDYNYNRWTQPGESQFYQLYQHQNPFYMNRF